jgi:hypothetical protein
VTVATRVAAKWSSVGVARPDEPVDFDALERKRGIVLPSSFRELWTLSDGTGAMDDDEFIFWPLDNITSDPSLGPGAAPGGLLVFADRRLGMRHYCLRFDGSSARDVVDIDEKIIAGSFDEFLERYLENPRSL